MSDARWLLSPDARPSVKVPTRKTKEQALFRLPTCIGRTPERRAIPRADIARANMDRANLKSTITARFHDETLGWFRVGDELGLSEPGLSEADSPSANRRFSALVLVGTSAAALLVVFALC